MKTILFLGATILGIINGIAFTITQDLWFGVWTVIMMLLAQDNK